MPSSAPSSPGQPSAKHHCRHSVDRVTVGIITVSDTRTASDDRSGDCIERLIREGGHLVIERRIVRDDADCIRRAVRAMTDSGSVDAVILTGGTGLAARDVTPDAVAELFDVTLDGFGELFRRESFAEIGAKALLSRATAGRIGRTLVFVLPGSTGACRTGVSTCILPVLRHAVGIARS